MDLTTSIRYSNLPNKATLEMVEAERKREEGIVTVGLQLEDGERRTGDFTPSTCLLDLMTHLAPNEAKNFQQPTIMYMRQEITGLPALRQKTLRELGLLGGRAVLRLLNKTEEGKQAHVSSVYNKSHPTKPEEVENITKKLEAEASKKENEKRDSKKVDNSHAQEINVPGPSNFPKDPHKFDPLKSIREMITPPEAISGMKTENYNMREKTNEDVPKEPPKAEAWKLIQSGQVKIKDTISNTSVNSIESQRQLERRLKIEEDITFLGDQKAIAFMPTSSENEFSDLPDDFYELTIEEVRKLYKDLQQNRLELEDTPLMTTTQKQELEKQASEQRLSLYKNVVVRVQFPDQMILQGIFLPSNTIGDVIDFIKQYLATPTKSFHIVTTPLKEILDPTMTLLQAKFVPCVLFHFKWLDDTGSQIFLKQEIYQKLTTCDDANILASKFRAPTRRKLDEPGSCQRQKEGTSSGKSSKMPKWFKK